MNNASNTIADQISQLPCDEFLASYRTLRLTTLDEHKREIKHASGFVLEVDGTLYLHTCWHVVTGLELPDAEVGRNFVQPRFLRVTGVGVDTEAGANTGDLLVGGPATFRIGGYESFELDLFQEDRPVWEQQADEHCANEDLNRANIYVPTYLDVVRIPIELSHAIKALWSIRYDQTDIGHRAGSLPDVVVTGYPFGFSPNEDNATSIFLKRRIASLNSRHPVDTYLDSGCSPAMSGGPVWTMDYRFLGIYRGIIFPDYEAGLQSSNDRHSALGLISEFWCLFNEHDLPKEARRMKRW